MASRIDFISDHGSIDSFICVVDGKNVQYELKKGIKNPHDSTLPEYPRVFTWNVVFSEDESKRVFTTYLFGGDIDGYYLTIKYVLRTGSLWKGKINKADINIDVKNIPRELIEDIKPDGYKYTKGRISWRLREFEPGEDISILLNNTAIRWCGQADKAIDCDSIKLMKECLQHYIESFNELPNEMYFLTNDRVTVKKKAVRLLSRLLQNKDKSTITLRAAYHLDKRETCDSLVHAIYYDLEAGIIQNDIDYWYLSKYISGRYLGKTELTYNILNRYVDILIKKFNGDKVKIDSIKQLQKKAINST